MPYIPQKDREPYTSIIQEINKKVPENEDAYFLLTGFIFDLLTRVYDPSTMRYWEHNEVIGMLECCKLEWYRKKQIDGYVQNQEWIMQREDNNRFTDELNQLESLIKPLDHIIKAGTLNFLITSILTYVFSPVVKPQHVKEDIISMVETVKLHWYEFITAPYEDEKLEENGDV